MNIASMITVCQKKLTVLFLTHRLLSYIHKTCHKNKTCHQNDNRNMSKLKGWTLQSSLLMLWMEKTRVNNQTKIAGK